MRFLRESTIFSYLRGEISGNIIWESRTQASGFCEIGDFSKIDLDKNVDKLHRDVYNEYYALYKRESHKKRIVFYVNMHYKNTD